MQKEHFLNHIYLLQNHKIVVQDYAKSRHIIKKTIINSYHIKMLNLSLKELELKAKNRGIKDYKSMSIGKLLRILNTPKPIRKNKAKQIKTRKF